MGTTDAQKRATKKYLDEKLDRITVRVPKGEREGIHDSPCYQRNDGKR